MSFAPHRILVTGATGFIGRAVCQRLKDRHQVIALVRPTSKHGSMFLGDARIQTVFGSMADIGLVLAGLGSIDAVIHLAWDGMSKEAQRDTAIQERNHVQSLAFVTAAKAAGCELFINGGSQAEYGSHSTLISETAICEPTSAYGQAKLHFSRAGAARCTELGMKWRMLRIFSVYGPHDHPWTLLPALLRALARQEQMPLTDCRQMWNYLYVDDAASAVEALLEPHCEDGIYNLASAHSAPLKEFVQAAWAMFPQSPAPEFGAVPHGPRGPHSLQPSVAKLVRHTNWREAVSFPAGLKHTWAALQAAPP